MKVLHSLLKLKPVLRMPAFPLRTISNFSTNKKLPIEQQLQILANNIDSSSSSSAPKQDYSEMVNNYIQLEQSSFTQYARQVQNDPQLMLMFLSTFEDGKQIAEYLPMLYPKIDFFQGTELLLLLEKVLAFKPKVKPKIPFPKPLEGIESILVIMGEIFEANKLVQWLKLIPLYNGTQHYVLYMGYFSILEKMSSQIKSRNQSLWIKCHQKIVSVLTDQNQSDEVRAGIITLALELNYGQAFSLLLLSQLNYQKLDPYKTVLLFTNTSKQLIKKKQSSIDGGQQWQKMEKMVKKCINQMAEPLIKLQFVEFMKVDIMVEMFGVLRELKEVRGVFVGLLEKLVSLIINKKFLRSMNELSTTELLTIFECLQKHKISNPKAIKLLLTLFSPHLHNMDKKQFVRLLKCLVTYVRQCEDYLINVRQVLEERKAEFSPNQIVQVNEVLRRVEVLFPRKFGVK